MYSLRINRPLHLLKVDATKRSTILISICDYSTILLFYAEVYIGWYRHWLRSESLWPLGVYSAGSVTINEADDDKVSTLQGCEIIKISTNSILTTLAQEYSVEKLQLGLVLDGKWTKFRADQHNVIWTVVRQVENLVILSGNRLRLFKLV